MPNHRAIFLPDRIDLRDNQRVKWFRFFSFLSMLFVFTNTPVFAQNCDESVRSLLQKMSSKGFDEKNLRFETFYRMSVDQKFQYKLELYDRGEYIGMIEINNLLDVDHPYVRLSQIPYNQHKGAGAASYLYLLGAKDVYAKTGKLIQQSHSTSMQARAVWIQLTERGFAKDNRFLQSPLHSNEINEMYRLYQTKVKVLNEFPRH